MSALGARLGKSMGSTFYVTVGWIGRTYESTAIRVTAMARPALHRGQNVEARRTGATPTAAGGLPETF